MATLLPVAGAMAGRPSWPLVALEVGDKALQVADGDRRAFLAQHAAAFALVLLRADAAGDGGQRIVFAHLGRRGQIIARIDQLHDLLDLDAHRAIDLTQPGLAQAMQRVASVSASAARQAQVHFLEVAARTCGVQLRHVRARNLHPFFQGRD